MKSSKVINNFKSKNILLGQQQINLTTEQKNILNDQHDRKVVIAGPGTGKTRLILELVKKLLVDGVEAKNITVLTFTKSNTRDFRLKSKEVLEKVPRICTIHSFALQELINNKGSNLFLPQPIRIADTYEETLIYEDIKRLLNIGQKNVEKLFRKLQTDWETLTADKEGWEQKFSDEFPQFIGAWEEHRQIYGYTLRGELVYRLKKYLERDFEYKSKNQIKYLIVDEYQDLNRCDQKVINLITQSSFCQLFFAGDDDQSIYGFREAYPEGIKPDFLKKDYPDMRDFKLSLCYRCDINILQLSLQVIQQDYNRILKKLTSVSKEKGIVKLYRFENANDEARAIAKYIKSFLDDGKFSPSDILILLRSDKNKKFSQPIIDELDKLGVATNYFDFDSIFKKKFGQFLLALIKYKCNENDSLAIRTLIELTPKLGERTYRSIYEKAKDTNSSFAQVFNSILGNGNDLKLTNKNLLVKLVNDINNFDLNIEPNLKHKLCKLSELIPNKYYGKNDTDKDEVLKKLNNLIAANEDMGSLEQLLNVVNDLIDTKEALVDHNKVNVMTMHKAKGIDSKIVIIPTLEDEVYRKDCNPDEERRLLYVSLTRAKNILWLTYCRKRKGHQGHSGTGKPGIERRLCRFLQDIPDSILKEEDGMSLNFNFIHEIRTDNLRY